MLAARIARKSHKFIALVIGVQLVLWTASGAYMVAVDLDFIHGDGLVRNLEPELHVGGPLVPLESIRAANPDVRSVSLRALPDASGPVYEVTTGAGIVLVDAATGAVLSPLAEERVASLARSYYAGQGSLDRLQLIQREEDKPQELQARPLPLWRVDFDDWLETSLYVHPDSGRLVTRRHRFWRWFDFLWSLHIMDYQERSDVNNWLLRASTVLGVTLAASGAWLVFYSFGFLQRRVARRKQAASGAVSRGATP